MSSSLFYLDHFIARSCLASPAWLKSSAYLLGTLITPMGHFVFWWLLILIFKKHRERILPIAGAITLTMLVTGLLKIAVGRSRPELLFTLGIHSFHFGTIQSNYLSFPSSHTAIAFTLLPLLLPYRRALLCAALLSFTRLILNEHYCTDLIAGALIGLFISHHANKIGQVIHYLTYRLFRIKLLE